MVVGHNPTAQSLSRTLLSPRDQKGVELTMRQGFPTCALGVYTFKADAWKDVDQGGAKLAALMAPPLRLSGSGQAAQDGGVALAAAAAQRHGRQSTGRAGAARAAR